MRASDIFLREVEFCVPLQIKKINPQIIAALSVKSKISNLK